MGDFNGGCGYVKKWEDIHLAKDDRFYWLINNGQDTTTETSDCPYDRIVIAGNTLVEAVIPESAKVFCYDEAYGLTRTQVMSNFELRQPSIRPIVSFCLKKMLHLIKNAF